MSKEGPKIRERMAALEAEAAADVHRPISDSETIVGIRRLGTIVHVWLLDSRTQSARRIEIVPEFIPAASMDSIITAQNEIHAALKGWENGV